MTREASAAEIALLEASLAVWEPVILLPPSLDASCSKITG